MGALRDVLRTAPSDVLRDALGMCSGCNRNASRNALGLHRGCAGNAPWARTRNVPGVCSGMYRETWLA